MRAATEQAVLDVLTKIRPQLVLADVRMSGIDGRALCHTLATDPRYAAIPRVLMRYGGRP